MSDQSQRKASRFWALAPGFARPTAFFQDQSSEVAADPSLRAYGACLALVNALTAMYWLSSDAARVLAGSQAPVCWPFFENCESWRLLSMSQWELVFKALLVSSICNALVFTEKDRTGQALWMLIGLSVAKTGMWLLDYRLVMNQHYIASWATFAYVCLPGRRCLIPVLIVCFYFWAGALKFNATWLSGEALFGRRPFAISDALVPAACAYVAVLETLGVFGILAKSARIFWGTLFQLIVFHVGSFWVVGFFYPVLMFLILAILPLARCHPAPMPTTNRAPRRYFALVLIVAFAAFQLIPRLIPGDESITGEGRMFALNMFDSRIECEPRAVMHTQGAADRVVPLVVPFLHERIVCDPIVYHAAAEKLCRGLEPDQTRDLDLILDSRRAGQSAFVRVIFVEGFCKAAPIYSSWRHNTWIAAEP